MKSEVLIKVAVLTRKMADQIVAPEYNASGESLFKRLLNAVANGAANRVGWTHHDSDKFTLFNEYGNRVYYAARFLHLVQWEGQLFWLPCPDRWTADKQDAGPQLFV